MLTDMCGNNDHVMHHLQKNNGIGNKTVLEIQ